MEFKSTPPIQAKKANTIHRLSEIQDQRTGQ